MRAGAMIRTGAAVERILVEKETAVGVVLAGGEEIRAPVVASSADPQRTLLKLLEPGLLDVQFAKRIRHLRMNGCVAKLHLALDGLPESWVGVAGRIVLAPASDHVERAFDGAKYGGVSQKPALEVVIPDLGRSFPGAGGQACRLDPGAIRALSPARDDERGSAQPDPGAQPRSARARRARSAPARSSPPRP